MDDLYKLHVEKLGHQEIILESLELLRNFHYNLDQVQSDVFLEEFLRELCFFGGILTRLCFFGGILTRLVFFWRNSYETCVQENLQYICLRLSCKARSLFNEMCMKPVKAGEKQVGVENLCICVFLYLCILCICVLASNFDH